MTQSPVSQTDPAIVGIDPGTMCGWAVRYDNGLMDSGVWRLDGGRFEGGGMRILRLTNHLESLARSVNIKSVWYEEVRRHAGTDAAHIYGGITHRIMEWCEVRQIPYGSIPVGTVKKFATGKGSADKQMMIADAKIRWPNAVITDSNEADARWIAECAASGRGV